MSNLYIFVIALTRIMLSLMIESVNTLSYPLNLFIIRDCKTYKELFKIKNSYLSGKNTFNLTKQIISNNLRSEFICIYFH